MSHSLTNVASVPTICINFQNEAPLGWEGILPKISFFLPQQELRQTFLLKADGAGQLISVVSGVGALCTNVLRATGLPVLFVRGRVLFSGVGTRMGADGCEQLTRACCCGSWNGWWPCWIPPPVLGSNVSGIYKELHERGWTLSIAIPPVKCLPENTVYKVARPPCKQVRSL